MESALPIDDARSRPARAVAHLKEVRRRAKSGTPTIVAWPAYGWLEGVLWGGSANRTWVVAHDPIPIRKQAFSGTFSKKLAKRFSRVQWISHTSAAAEATESELGFRPLVALHPILTEQHPRLQSVQERKVVTVLGQFKPSRNLDVLTDLAAGLEPDRYRLQIVGRGWPAVPGWTVTNRFVSESELDGVLAKSDAVVIPYRKYWQSGIAVRAIEHGAQVVGEERSS